MSNSRGSEKSLTFIFVCSQNEHECLRPTESGLGLLDMSTIWRPYARSDDEELGANSLQQEVMSARCQTLGVCDVRQVQWQVLTMASG